MADSRTIWTYYMDTQDTAMYPASEDRPTLVILAGICALILTVGLARFAYTPMLPIMEIQVGLGPLEAGWLAAINYAGYMAGTLIAASISNLRKKFVLYRMGLVVAVISTAAMGIMTNWTAWAILRFMAGLSSTAGLLLASGLILNWLLRQGHRPELGLHFIGMGLGIALSGLVVIGTVGSLDWGEQWLTIGVVGIAFFIPAWLWLPAPAIPAVSATYQQSEVPPPSSRWMFLFTLAYFCAGFGFAVGATFIVAILEKLPMLADQGGWVWVLVGIAATPSAFIWDRIAKSMGEARALMLAFALQAIGTILPVLSDSILINLLSAALFGGTFVGIVSLTLTLAGRHFPKNPAKAMARITLGYGVAQIVSVR